MSDFLLRPHIVDILGVLELFVLHVCDNQVLGLLNIS